MASELVSILEGDTFVVSDRRGDVDASPDEPHGLFQQDTRFLSRWRLTVDGRPPAVLSTDDVNYFSAQFFLVPPDSGVYVEAAYSIIRTRAVGNGFHEDLTVLNHAREPLELELRVDAAADFADLFEVKDALSKRGEHFSRVDEGRLVLGYRRDGFVRETWITASAPEAELEEDGLRFRLRLDAQDEWTTCLDVLTGVHAFGTESRRVKYGHGDSRARPNMSVTLEEWLDAAPALSSDRRSLELTYERSLVDLAALRFYTPLVPGMAVPAAGLPWFMTVFGRDSLITSYQTLPFAPELAITTLRVLAARQATRIDDFRDAEPGKILHESRLGELTAFEERPHSPYYGTADATPLFVILLDETVRWTGDTALARELEPEARAALGWIREHGDRDLDGYVEYERRNVETGLENQCWKDSWNSIVFADGTLARPPIATCEIQGYVYDAKMRGAHLARRVWGDVPLAERLESDADELRRRFNEEFWLPEREFFAFALDGEKRRVDSLTSNVGHLLWSGIVEDEKAEAVVRHLTSDALFSGWGIRTLAADESSYNPLGYHTGTVWPHDNSLIAAGLARYGFREEAGAVAFAMLEAAESFDHRLPEAFAGYARGQTSFPVEYPTACSPQAWASGAPLLFITTMLGLEPQSDGVRTDPVLPEGLDRLELTGAPGHGAAAAPTPPYERRSMAPPTRASPPRNARELFQRFDEFIDPARTRGEHGTYRFEVEGVGSWHIAVDDGRVRATESDDDAACVIRIGETLLLAIARGERTAGPAYLKGGMSVEGDLSLAMKLERFRPFRWDAA